ncbi:hypothetical protein D3C72_1112070 [compost metagenome]
MTNSQRSGTVPCPPINVLWVLVLPLVTCGIYTGIWHLKRAKELNALPEGEQVGLLPIYYLIVSAVVTLPTTFITVPKYVEHLLVIETFVYVLVMVWVAFGIRRKLQALGAETSVGFTFLFNLAHLQWVINRHHYRSAIAEAA